jgi:nucleotide-binding universal stress UspA family protein
MALLVPLDLSAPSQGALALALLLSCTDDEEAILLHVTPGSALLGDLVTLYTLSEPFIEQGRVARLRTRTGTPSQVICAEAHQRACRWIVMGAGDRRSPERNLLGQVLRRASVPVLAVRQGRLGRIRGPIPRAETCRCGADVGFIPSETVSGRLARELSRKLANQLGTYPVPVSSRPLPEGREGRRCVALAPALMVLAREPGIGREPWFRRLMEDGERTIVLVCEPRRQAKHSASGENTHPPG